MKNIVKQLYKKDPKLALKVAKVTEAKSLDEVVNFLSKNLFNYINNYANKQGYRFKISAPDFEKYINNILVTKLK